MFLLVFTIFTGQRLKLELVFENAYDNQGWTNDDLFISCYWGYFAQLNLLKVEWSRTLKATFTPSALLTCEWSDDEQLSCVSHLDRAELLQDEPMIQEDVHKFLTMKLQMLSQGDEGSYGCTASIENEDGEADYHTAEKQELRVTGKNRVFRL